MRKILLLFNAVFTFGLTYGQEKQMMYVDVNGEPVSSIDSAYVIREIDKPKQGSLFNFNDFYKENRKLKMSGAGYFYNGVMKFHGNFTIYDIDGTKTNELSFEHGQNKGAISEYFKNGKLHKKFERIKAYEGYYDFDRTFAEANKVPNWGYYLYKIDYLTDSLGKTVINNGKGYLVEKLNYLDEDFLEEGNYVGGFREGLWTGKSLTTSKSYQEYYKKGVLHSGKVIFDGRETHYSQLFTAPIYKYRNNHIADLYLRDVGFYKKYVPGYKRTDREDYWNSATLYINENGYVERVIFAKEIANKAVEEDMTKTLLAMPKWKPAKLRGLKTRAIYTCAIPFFKSME